MTQLQYTPQIPERLTEIILNANSFNNTTLVYYNLNVINSLTQSGVLHLENAMQCNNNNNNNNNNNSFDIQHKNEKEKLKKEYLRRLRLFLSTELSAKNKIQATGSLAVPVLRYSSGIINWHQEELQKLDRKARNLLTIKWTASPKSGCRSLLCPQKTGRKGLDAVRSSPCSRNYKIGGICR